MGKGQQTANKKIFLQKYYHNLNICYSFPKTEKMTQTSFNVYTITSQFIAAKSSINFWQSNRIHCNTPNHKFQGSQIKNPFSQKSCKISQTLCSRKRNQFSLLTNLCNWLDGKRSNFKQGTKCVVIVEKETFTPDSVQVHSLNQTCAWTVNSPGENKNNRAK